MKFVKVRQTPCEDPPGDSPLCYEGVCGVMLRVIGNHTRGSVAGASELGRIVRAFDIKGAAFDLTCSGLDQFSCGNRSPTMSRQALST